MALVKKTFPVKNMMCAMCVSHVRNAIANIKGVKDVNVNLASNSALVEYDDAAVNPEIIRNAVVAAGYDMDATPSAQSADAEVEAQKKNSKGFLGKLFGR